MDRMGKTLPVSQETLLIRTDFSDEQAWQGVRARIETPNEDGFKAYVHYVDDPVYADLTPQQILALLPHDHRSSLLAVVDKVTLLSPSDMPILVMDTAPEDDDDKDEEVQRKRQIRVAVTEFYAIENNVSLANMDFLEFAECVGEDGVFRGF